MSTPNDDGTDATDARGADASSEVAPRPDAGSDAPRPDASADVPLDEGPPDAGEDVAFDAPLLDALDATLPDAPSLDATLPDAPSPDAPSLDVPSPDVPSPDVPLLDAPDAPADPMDTGPDPLDAFPTADVTPDASPADAPSDAALDVSGPTCALPLAGTLALVDANVTGTLSSADLVPSTSCASTAYGDAVYALTVPVRTGLALVLSEDYNFSVLSIRRACDDPATEVACARDGSYVAGTTEAGLRTVLEPGAYFITIGARTTSGSAFGPYQLRVHPFDPAPNATCDGALPVAPGAPQVGPSTDNGITSDTACLNNGATELFYAVHVPANTQARINVEPRDGVYPAVRVLDHCGAGTCLSSATQTSLLGQSVDDFVVNRSPSDRDVVLSVSTTTPRTAARFTVSVELTSLMSAPANATCANATPVGNGSLVAGPDPATGYENRDSTCSTMYGTPAVYYSVALPPGSLLTATTTTSGASPPVVQVLDSCASTTCLADSGNASSVTSRTVRFANSDTANPRTVLLAVHASSAGVSGPFSLAVSVQPLASNAYCAAPTPVTGGTVLRGQDAALGYALPPTSCTARSAVNMLYYSAEVPPGATLTATATAATGSPGGSRELHILGDCTGATCLNSATDVARFTNSGGVSRSVVLGIGCTTPNASCPFDLWVSVDFSVPNAACSTPMAVADGDVLHDQNDYGVPRTPTVACGTNTMSHVLYYSTTVPAGYELTARTTPTSPIIWSPLVWVQPTCRDQCVHPLEGNPRVVHYGNNTGAAQTVIIGVGADNFTSYFGTFDLAISMRPQIYAFSTIAPACDALDASTVVAGPLLEDTTSTVQPLPFPFWLAGDAVAYYSVGANGFAQLYPDATGTPNNGYSSDLPPASTSAPNGVVAPFWTEMTLPDARAAVVGTAPFRHFTIQWTNGWGPTGSSVTLQAQLFETTGVIEYHYCQLNSATADIPWRTGGYATIGAESLDGTRGALYSFKTPNVVSTTSAIRLTPVP